MYFFQKKKKFFNKLRSRRSPFHHIQAKKKKTFTKTSLCPSVKPFIPFQISTKLVISTNINGQKIVYPLTETINSFNILYVTKSVMSVRFGSLFDPLLFSKVGSFLKNVIDPSTGKFIFPSLVLLSKSSSFFKVKLLSGKTKLIPNSFLTYNSSRDIPRLLKKKVRGIAKNPVDHPNGGNSNTKQPLKTPWSFIAKKNK